MLLKNNATVDIVNYPVDGKLWSVLAGQTAEVPQVVGEFLLRVYGSPKFLIEFKPDVSAVITPKAEVKEEAKAEVVTPTEEVKTETPQETKKYTRDELEEMKFKDLQQLYKAKTGKGKILSKEGYIEFLLSL